MAIDSNLPADKARRRAQKIGVSPAAAPIMAANAKKPTCWADVVIELGLVQVQHGVLEEDKHVFRCTLDASSDVQIRTNASAETDAPDSSCTVQVRYLLLLQSLLAALKVSKEQMDAATSKESLKIAKRASDDSLNLAKQVCKDIIAMGKLMSKGSFGIATQASTPQPELLEIMAIKLGVLKEGDAEPTFHRVQNYHELTASDGSSGSSIKELERLALQIMWGQDVSTWPQPAAASSRVELHYIDRDGDKVLLWTDDAVKSAFTECPRNTHIKIWATVTAKEKPASPFVDGTQPLQATSVCTTQTNSTRSTSTTTTVANQTNEEKANADKDSLNVAVADALADLFSIAAVSAEAGILAALTMEQLKAAKQAFGQISNDSFKLAKQASKKSFLQARQSVRCAVQAGSETVAAVASLAVPAGANAATATPEQPQPPQSLPFIHGRHTCDQCLTTPSLGKRLHAVNLRDFNLCEGCNGNYKGTVMQFEEAQLDRDSPFQDRRNLKKAMQDSVQGHRYCGRQHSAHHRWSPPPHARGPHDGEPVVSGEMHCGQHHRYHYHFAMAKARPSDERRKSLAEQICVPVVSDFFPIERYYDAAELLYQIILFTAVGDDLDLCYVYCKRYCLFCIDAIPTHNYYRTQYNEALKNKHTLQVSKVLTIIEQVAEKMDGQEIQRAADQKRERLERERQEEERLEVWRRKIKERRQPRPLSDASSTANVQQSAIDKLKLPQYPTGTASATKQQSRTRYRFEDVSDLTLDNDTAAVSNYAICHLGITPLAPPILPPAAAAAAAVADDNDAVVQKTSKFHQSVRPPPDLRPEQPLPPTKVHPMPMRQMQDMYVNAFNKHLYSMGLIQIYPIDTYQGRVPESTNGCTVISALIAARHLNDVTNIGTIGSDAVKFIIDRQCGPILRDIRRKLDLGSDALIIPSDVHDHLVDAKILHQQHFAGAAGGNIMDRQHYGEFIKLLSEVGNKGGNSNGKAAATLFFRGHVVSIVKCTTEDGRSCYDLIDSLPSVSLSSSRSTATRTRCADVQSLDVLLTWFALRKFSYADCDYFDRNQWDDAMADVDPRVFQGFVWST